MGKGTVFSVIAMLLCVVLAVAAFVMRGDINADRQIDYKPVHEEKRLELKSSQQIEEEVQQAVEEAEKQEAIAAIPRDEWYMKLVNRSNPLSADFMVETELYGEITLDVRLVEALDAMVTAASEDGIDLLPYSGYRDYETQNGYFNNIVDASLANGLTQEQAESPEYNREDPAEYSEHFLGLAVDILAYDYQYKDRGFADTEEYQWLSKYAAEYGFILRYPEGKEGVTGIPFKPFHWRYVGPEQAKLIVESGLVLEEYLPQE